MSWAHSVCRNTFWQNVNQPQILPDTLCGFWTGCKVLVFGCDTKVYGEKTSKQNITSHLCSLMGSISWNDITGPQQYQIIQSKSHLFSLLGRIILYNSPDWRYSKCYLLRSICLLHCFVLFMFALMGISDCRKKEKQKHVMLYNSARYKNNCCSSVQLSHADRNRRAIVVLEAIMTWGYFYLTGLVF